MIPFVPVLPYGYTEEDIRAAYEAAGATWPQPTETAEEKEVRALIARCVEAGALAIREGTWTDHVKRSDDGMARLAARAAIEAFVHELNAL